MTASLNAASSFHFPPVRDARDLNASGSRGNRESFSQMLRHTSGDEKSSGSNRSREADKRDRKSADKDNDANTTPSAAANSNATVEKSALPITFLFGFPTEQQFGSAGTQDGGNALTSEIAGKPGPSNRSSQADLAAFSGGIVDQNGDPVLLMTGVSNFSGVTSPETADSQKAGASGSTSDNAELSGIGSSGNNARGAAGALSANTLAFAMRLGSGEASSTSKAASAAEPASPVASDNAQANSGSAMPSVVQAASGAALEEKAHEHDSSGQEQNLVDPSALHTSEPFDNSKITEENAPAPAAQVPADSPGAATAEPVRNVHMQLVSDDNRRVDVRLIDRGGELHVSVKSADTALTQNLQDHLPDLTARLEKQHMQTEVWVPKASEPTKAEGGNTNGSLSDPNGRSYYRNSDGQKEGQSQKKPDWVDALENYT